MLAWYPTAADVHRIHAVLIASDPVDRKHPGLLREGVVEHILLVNTPRLILPDVFGTAAGLLHDLAIAHAYEAGNKRTAFAVAAGVLEANGSPIDVAQAEVVRYLRALTHLRFRTEDVEAWLRAHARNL